MWLNRYTPTRIRLTEKGYIVEARFSNWIGIKYWRHIISYSGMPDDPFYYSTFEMAEKEAVKYFNWDLLKESRRTK